MVYRPIWLHIDPTSVETVVSLLWGMARQWKIIAEGMGFDEDLVDEIFTNNETDEACLQDCVEQWMRLDPTWQRLAQVLSDMGQDTLAQMARKKGELETVPFTYYKGQHFSFS